jgi:DNA ligase 1
MKLAELVRTSSEVAATSKRLAKIAALADLLRAADADEAPIAIGFLIGWPRQGKLGIGWAAVRDASKGSAANEATLELRDVDVAFSAIAAARGKEKARILADVYARATAEEQAFLGALVIGEVRQGALEGVLLEAVAKAADVPSADVRRAAMMAGDLGVVAGGLFGPEGAASLAAYRLQLFRPVQPMLADSASTVAEAVAECAGDAVIEWKLDGARIQVHAGEGRVAVYTRNLNDVTERVPEVAEAMHALGLVERGAILDGEVIALMADGRPLEFQDTMSRFGRKLGVAELRAKLPLTPFFFDVLHLDGVDVIDEPLVERLARLDAIVPLEMRPPRIVTGDADEGARFQADALARGHEGVMIKALDAPYAAGRRGSAWIKVKTPRTLDLVVLAVEWGSGRRQGWLSNLHLGARDPANGGFVMLGKTFKGLTDELLEWQTKELLARETKRDGHIVYVRPELVVEIAFNEVQRSTQYPGGVALRFARVKGYRPDKSASEADTIDAVRAFLPGAGETRA